MARAAPALPFPVPDEYKKTYLEEVMRVLRLYFVRIGGTDPIVSSFSNITTYTASASIGLNDGVSLVDTTAGNVTITLPDPATSKEYMFIVKRITGGSNTLTIVGASGNIDGAANASITTQYLVSVFKSDGTNYWIISAGPNGYGY